MGGNHNLNTTFNMKKSILILAAMTALATSLLSCNSNEPKTKTLSNEEVAQALNHTVGDYSGPMTFVTNEPHKPNSKWNKVDTVFNMKWRVGNDTTLTIDHIPMKALTDFITQADLKEALNEAEPQALTCKMQFFDNAPVQFLIKSIEPQTFNVTCGGKAHQVVFHFHTTQFPMSWGYYDYKFSKCFFARITTENITVDGETKDGLVTGGNTIAITTEKDAAPFDITSIISKYNNK